MLTSKVDTPEGYDHTAGGLSGFGRSYKWISEPAFLLLPAGVEFPCVLRLLLRLNLHRNGAFLTGLSGLPELAKSVAQ